MKEHGLQTMNRIITHPVEDDFKIEQVIEQVNSIGAYSMQDCMVHI